MSINLAPIPTKEYIQELYNARVNDSSYMQQVMREITDLYQGDIAVPLPELQADERPGIANLARAGIDQKAQRIASVFPEIKVSPTRPTQGERKRAGERRRALYAFHEWNHSQRKTRRAARYLVAYASAPLRIGVDFKSQMPTFEVRSPLGAYPAPSGDPDQMVPEDCIFASRRSMGWLRKFHPQAYSEIFKEGDTADTPLDLLEYCDANWVHLVVGRRGTGDSSWDHEYAVLFGASHTVNAVASISIYPNRIGMTPVVIPGEITIGPKKSTYHQIIGMYQASAALDALSLVATRKGIMQEEWLVAHPGESSPEVVRAADPFEGIPGIVTGGQLENRSVDPQFAGRMAIGDKERAMRLTAGLPAELGGEASTNVRTGARADQLLSAVLDFPVHEAHQIFEESFEYVNEGLARSDHGHFKDMPRVFQVDFQAERGELKYTPGELWKGPSGDLAVKSKVSYFAAGLDAGDRIIALGQRLGMGTMSKDTVMRHDPLVDDVDGEKSKSTAEEIERAILTQVQTLASDPASPYSMDDYTLLLKQVRQGDTIDVAWDVVQEAIQKRQEAAAQAEQAGAGGLPGAPLGAGPEAPGEVPGAIAAPPQDLQNLSSLLTSARTPAAFATAQG